MRKLTVVFVIALLLLCGISFSSSVVAGKPVAITKTPGLDEMYVEAAFDPGTNKFFVVWEASDQVRHTWLKGRTLDGKNSSLSSPRTYAAFPFVSHFLFQFDAIKKWFLLLWQDGSEMGPVHLSRVSPGGAVLGSVAINAGRAPILDSMAYHPINSEYLVHEPMLRLNSDGQVLGMKETPLVANSILIADNLSPNYFFFYRVPVVNKLCMQVLGKDATAITQPRTFLLNQYNSVSVAFHPSRREFLVSYLLQQGYLKTFRLRENGTRIDLPRVVSRYVSSDNNIVQYYNGGYIVVYSVYTAQGLEQLFLRRLNEEGISTGPPEAITSPLLSIDRLRVIQGKGGQFLAVWAEATATGFGFDDIYTELFSVS